MFNLAKTTDEDTQPNTYYANCKALNPQTATVAAVGINGGGWHKS